MYKIMCKNIARVGQPTDDNMTHSHSILDTYGYKHTLRTCNSYCFSIATIVTRTCLGVTLFVHCVPCYPSTLFVHCVPCYPSTLFVHCVPCYPSTLFVHCVPCYPSTLFVHCVPCYPSTLFVHCVPCYPSTLWNLTACDCKTEDIFKVLCYGDDGYEYYCLLVCVYCDEYVYIVMNIHQYLGKNSAAPSLGLSRRDGGSTLLQNVGEFLPNHMVSHPGLH